MENRDKRTLMEIIGRHVAAGSIVCTDLWGGYQGLDEEFDLEHRTVNHTQNFVDPETGVHTNTIEGTWNGIKLKIAPRNRTRQGMEGNRISCIIRTTSIFKPFLVKKLFINYNVLMIVPQ